ncbi:MAG: FAD/NAD(P)-binding oxidoreductase [Saprospiraceae bacterium]|nr:FAD/NAD(P)-binding oxidoreductase [Saprospiraceae bacterium]
MNTNGTHTHHEILVVGGGTAGLTVAAMLRNLEQPPEVTLIEPSDKHYYQPIWTLVGAGVFPKEVSERSQADYIPRGVRWIRDAVTAFDPAMNAVHLAGGETHTYQVLVVAAGIQIDWDRIPGLKESVGVPGTGVCSNYAYETVDSTWENIRNLKSGTAIFTHPSGAIKCGGAPMKITFLAADYWRKQGLSQKINIKLVKPGGAIFGVEKYKEPLARVADKFAIEPVWHSDLIALRPDKREAVFRNKKTEEEFVEHYDMIHVTPPQSAPEFIRKSDLANEKGWVEVNKATTQHVRYPNVFALGDCSSLPTSKTGAAIRKQAPVTVKNIASFLAGSPLEAVYNGYTSCPVVTGYGKLIMAEFDYDGQPKESFPFDQAQERYSMYALKAYALPKLYWHGMLKGREF